ncbi:MAG TPA: glycoside hydrolase family 57 protein [Jatrophihabitans sp.]|uniref:1,4-alpha-glucan branching protein domain-containing protein n=1 Tax=Jatrophihabitans sp. TaxID=1932789 RepID=UPI002EFDF963
MTELGRFSLVLHTHLPWVAHNGAWPVGEEWLHQAFTGSWRRVLRVLETLAEHGYREVATLGVTPVVAAMLDDPYCLSEIHSWAGRWQLRAEELSARSGMGQLAEHERREALACLADLQSRWLTGGLSAVLRPLVDSGVVELLSGPATHPFLPLLTERFAAAQLSSGLADTQLRFGSRPGGIWAPECGYAPGMEDFYAGHGVTHFLVDGPAVGGDTGFARPVGDSGVLAFARDLDVSYRIWSSRTGYPGGACYRDFHTFDHASGFRPARVTGAGVPAEAKQPWDRRLASAAALRDAQDFVAAVARRLTDLRAQHGREALVVAAFDTELFGHWWYEGPEFLDAVLRLLPQAGVRLSTLRGAAEAGLVAGRIELPVSSWGAGKDWRVWDNDAVTELNDEIAHLQKRLFQLLDSRPDGAGRDPAADQLVREAFLLSSSDWAFMISRDSAADYARQRARLHADRFTALADAIESGVGADLLAARLREVDGPFGRLDARTC